MTSRPLLFLVLFISSLAVSAQSNVRPVHIGLVYPISSNGANAKEYTNLFSLHAIAGVSGSEDGFCAAGVSNIIYDSAKGGVFAGFSNHINGSAQGGIFSGFLTTVRYNIKGVQAAGFLNLTGSINGAQLAGFANITKHNMSGIQIAGFFNNATDVKGIQLAGFINRGRNVNSQLAGFINIAGKVKGVQLAGFINIADSSDCPIGIVNIVQHGEKSLGITIDETGTSVLALRSGGKRLYGILGVGGNLRLNRPLYALEAGLGAHFPVVPHFRLNLEAAANSVVDFKRYQYYRSSLRILGEVHLGNRIGVFAGPTFNYSISTRYHDPELVSSYLWRRSYWGNEYGMYLGAIGGVQVKL